MSPYQWMATGPSLRATCSKFGWTSMGGAHSTGYVSSKERAVGLPGPLPIAQLVFAREQPIDQGPGLRVCRGAQLPLSDLTPPAVAGRDCNSRYSARGRPRPGPLRDASNHPAEESFEVTGLGDGRVHRVVGPLPALLEDLQAPAGAARLAQQDALQR